MLTTPVDGTAALARFAETAPAVAAVTTVECDSTDSMVDSTPVSGLDREYPDILTFFALYLLIAGLPYLYLNWEAVETVVSAYYPPDPVGLVLWVLGALVLFIGLVLADPGVERYVEFLFWPTDVVSALVDATYVWAAMSWWVIPELARVSDLTPSWELYLGGVFLSHLPPVLFLTLLTTAGFAKRRDDKW